jgi:hypothetical protein
MLQVNFAPYYIWAGAEVAIALVCLAIPTLRPLYQIRGDGKSAGRYERTDACERHRTPRRATDLEFIQPALNEARNPDGESPPLLLEPAHLKHQPSISVGRRGSCYPIPLESYRPNKQ